MRPRLLAAAVLVATVWLIAGAAARAQSPLADTARLQGRFALSGQVTIAVHIRGEHVGQTVERSWTFSPLCAIGPCQFVQLTRHRAAGTDTLVLQLTGADQYSGSGSFYAPLRCGRRTSPKGMLVPFTIAVQITNAKLAGDVPVATQINASYTNPQRQNRTRCVALPGHDTAVYHGSATG